MPYIKHLKQVGLAGFILLSSLLMSSLYAQNYKGSSSIHFKGNSNLHGFSGGVQNVPTSVQLLGNVFSARLVISIPKMTTKDKKRDKNMHKMFKTPSYPSILVEASKVSFSQAKPKGKTPGRLPVTITIQGKKHHTVARVASFVQAGKKANAKISIRLSLKKLGLKAPTALFGTIRVKDHVDVLINTALRSQ